MTWRAAAPSASSGAISRHGVPMAPPGSFSTDCIKRTRSRRVASRDSATASTSPAHRSALASPRAASCAYLKAALGTGPSPGAGCASATAVSDPTTPTGTRAMAANRATRRRPIVERRLIRNVRLDRTSRQTGYMGTCREDSQHVVHIPLTAAGSARCVACTGTLQSPYGRVSSPNAARGGSATAAPRHRWPAISPV